MLGGCRRGGSAALRPIASQGPAVTTDDSASFLLPGLVHQFGNILLTVQGNLMHLDGADLERVQADVLSAAKRGGGSLQVMRCLLNAGSSEPTIAWGPGWEAPTDPIVCSTAAATRRAQQCASCARS